MLDHQLARRLVQDVVAAALDDLAAAKDAVAVDIDPIFYRTFLAALARFFRIGGQGERHDAGILDSSRSLGRRRRRGECRADNAENETVQFHGEFSSSTTADESGRSEERRVGKECGSTGRSRWVPFH